VGSDVTAKLCVIDSYNKMFLCYHVFICTVKILSSFVIVASKIYIMMVLGSMKDKGIILLKSGAELLVIAIDKVTQGLLIMHPISFVITRGLTYQN